MCHRSSVLFHPRSKPTLRKEKKEPKAIPSKLYYSFAFPRQAPTNLFFPIAYTLSCTATKRRLRPRSSRGRHLVPQNVLDKLVVPLLPIPPGLLAARTKMGDNTLQPSFRVRTVDAVLHRRYGSVVRAGPNSLPIADLISTARCMASTAQDR